MKKFSIVIDTNTRPTMGEYSSLRPAVPTLYLLDGTDGAAIVFAGGAVPATMWMPKDQYYNLVSLADAEPVEPVKPTVTGISENTLLKALAIAQMPELAINLVKE